MEEQANIGNTGIGTKEPENTKLEPASLKIVSYVKEPIEKAKADKIVFEVKHPAKEETIHISAVLYLDGKAVKTSGTWFNLDDDGNIFKGSALAVLMEALGAKTLDETVGKECDSELDEKGYLAFKAY